MGKLHLIDLAGGERVDISRPQGSELVNAQFINKSLLAFGEVLHTLASNAVIGRKNTRFNLQAAVAAEAATIPAPPTTPSANGVPAPPSTPGAKHISDLHVPYLDNKLTHFLKDSLGGLARTTLITCVGPEADNYNVNLHCFQYASRALKVGNLVTCIHVDIPSHLEIDPSSELSIIK